MNKRIAVLSAIIGFGILSPPAISQTIPPLQAPAVVSNAPVYDVGIRVQGAHLNVSLASALPVWGLNSLNAGSTVQRGYIRSIVNAGACSGTIGENCNNTQIIPGVVETGTSIGVTLVSVSRDVAEVRIDFSSTNLVEMREFMGIQIPNVDGRESSRTARIAVGRPTTIQVDGGTVEITVKQTANSRI